MIHGWYPTYATWSTVKSSSFRFGCDPGDSTGPLTALQSPLLSVECDLDPFGLESMMEKTMTMVSVFL